MQAILEGIKVLDLTRVVAGPLCTQVLADMGATVFKIERPGQGDDTRRMGPFLADPQTGGDSNDSALFLAYNRGKRSLTVDIAEPRGAALVRRLAARCDVVVENYKVGTLARYGLDYATLARDNPRLVYCSVTGFGQDGPYAARPAYDFILQGQAGLMSTCGRPDGEPGGGPMRTAIPIADVVTGLYAGNAVLGALLHVQRTGEGQHLDAAMLDASVALNGHLAVGYLMTGRLPSRMGNSNPIASPSEVFDCADGQLIVAVGNNGQFDALCRLLGLEQLPADPRFATNALRVTHRLALREELAPCFAPRRRAEIVASFEPAGIPCGPINTMADVFEDPQSRHRELVQRVPHARGGEVDLLRSPLRFSRTPVQHGSPPVLGEHTAEVLAAELGLSEAQVQALAAEGVV
ncbi:CaiB/BaiF CoA-transferase family protein [Ramlibacter tataouinensis]|uniref:CaiB/BaiF CoA transferase family protein n=1 Tax=Ramlibacter tataouinensis TaxID=94132 RepID=UPI0022F3C759|nr:CaiB/BaiF CoA-transferase family protein [Ramlibacter tataouinensis]WBY02870.1 CaiB/BaiF CoA-transferase family protein [Ramlibacter tataouinensis]